MADIASNTSFTESYYGSMVNLHLRLDRFKVSGYYRTPPAAGMFGGYIQGFGQSIIEGDISPGSEGGTKITGEWVHTAGPLEKGTFMVQWNQEVKAMKGWWATDADSDARHEWIWMPITTRFQYARSFVHSNGMVRYTMFCCWMYFVMTAISLGYSIKAPPGNTASHHGLIFNSMYTLTYLSFVVSYMLLYKKPAGAYAWGVRLYTIGYMAFVVLYAVSLASLPKVGNVFYVIGSVLFLVGSGFLLTATAPAPVGVGKWSPVDIGGSLFWGSFAFLLGSVAFTADSTRVLAGEGSTPWLGQAGNAIFTVGRIYFIWGSSTGEVGIIFVPKHVFWSKYQEINEYRRRSTLALFSTKGSPRGVQMSA